MMMMGYNNQQLSYILLRASNLQPATPETTSSTSYFLLRSLFVRIYEYIQARTATYSYVGTYFTDEWEIMQTQEWWTDGRTWGVTWANKNENKKEGSKIKKGKGAPSSVMFMALASRVVIDEVLVRVDAVSATEASSARLAVGFDSFLSLSGHGHYSRLYSRQLSYF